MSALASAASEVLATTTTTKPETGTATIPETTASTPEVDTKNGVTQSFPPSHILEDGRLIYLPPPNASERSRFFERSIARHGLLQADMEKSDDSETNKTKTKQDVQKVLDDVEGETKETNNNEASQTKDKTAPKIHPLAVASARLQSNGLNELNRAINLATLVSTGEFFSYTNVVDPSYDADATTTATTAATATKKEAVEGGGVVPKKAVSSAAQYYSVEATARRTEALFSLKRKRAQFEKASQVLERHEKRLWAGIRAQQVIDKRLFELRKQWRLVAPEHGTRARLHAARTNEVIAVDVDVYDRDRVHGGNQALMGNKSRIGLAGRMASRVPRFATIELRDTYKVPKRKTKEEDTGEEANDPSLENAAKSTKKSPSHRDDDNDEEMKDAGDETESEKKDGDSKKKGNDEDAEMRDSASEAKNKDSENKTNASDDYDVAKWTRAEPFAVADPTLGRVIENFDPSKIPMLNLQLDIQKSSTGFLQSAFLEPMSTLSRSGDSSATADDKNNNGDEELLISLQHSLFCANLFESMRSELDPDHGTTTNSSSSSGSSNNARTFSVKRPKALQSTSWLACESEENFLAPPSSLVGDFAGRGLGALSVVHCHEGEVKVQLDSEYQLCLKLVEANAEQTIKSTSEIKREQSDSKQSGSQSPAQLHAFCRALLLYAQDVYHKHSLYLHEREKKMRQDELAKGDAPKGLARIRKEDAPEKARILQSCVSLGSKMLFEQRIRKALSRIRKWLQTTHNGEKLIVEWLALSMFDLHSKFTICCRDLVVDGIISRDTLTITKVTDDTEDYRKVHFHTEKEFELYLKMELRRQLE